MLLIKRIDKDEYNAGYCIKMKTENTRTGDIFALGYNPNKNDYVTWWEVEPGNYCMGNYFENRSDANMDLIERTGSRI